MYVLLASSYLDILVTSRRTRQPTVSYLVSMHSSTCSNRSNNSSAVLIYIRRSLLRPQWSRLSSKSFWSYSPYSLWRPRNSSSDNRVSASSLPLHLTQHDTVKFVKKFLGQKDVEAALQRLDRLTHDEARSTAAETLRVTHGLVHNMSVVMEGKQTYLGLYSAI
jgi:hypothetical protein